MFFFKKFLKQKPKTFIDIDVLEEKTDINVYTNYGLNEYIKTSIPHGYKTILDNSYYRAKMRYNIEEINIDEYIEDYFPIVRSDIGDFMKYLESKILCGPALPSKIDKVYFNCNGPDLFKKEFSLKFYFYDK